MAGTPELTVHTVPFSHPCLAVTTALDRLGFAYEKIEHSGGTQGDEVEKVFGEGRRTVPAVIADGQKVHGTSNIFAWIDSSTDQLHLYPDGEVERIRELEMGLCEDLQTAARTLAFGALHFRPEALGTFAGGEPLNPAGTDFAIKFLRGAWRYTDTTAEKVASELQALPASIDAVDRLADEGLVAGDDPTALDYQIGSSLHLLMKIGDVRPLIEGRRAHRLVNDWFESPVGNVPAGAFPPDWIPEPEPSGLSR